MPPKRIVATPLQPEQVRSLHEFCHACPQGFTSRSHCPFFRLSLLSYATRCTVLNQLTCETAVGLFRLAEDAGCGHARVECETLFGPESCTGFVTPGNALGTA
jgi:hypothetical protein